MSEELYHTLHCRRDDVVKMDEKDSNNNATITTIPSTKVKSKIDKANMIQKPIDIKNSAAKAVKIVENNSKSFENTSSSSLLQSGTNTLKRKRETKSPTKQAADSTTYESSKKQQQQQQQEQQLLSPTVATILVSTKSTKTKSGLPLLLKK